MAARILSTACLGALVAVGALAAKLPEWYTRVLGDAEFKVRLVQSVTEIEGIVGDGLEGDVTLVELRVRPLYGSEFTLSRDDFLLRARNTNDTSVARTPDRIAGSGVLDLTAKTTNSSAALFAEDTNSPIWGGVPGTGGRPRRLGGPPSGVGSGGTAEIVQTVEGRTEGVGTAAERLQASELPLEMADEPASGFLYFEIPAKVKRKHLELSYDGTLGKFRVEFKRPE